MSHHEPTATPHTPGPRHTAPAGPPVPDDRVHGDSLSEGEAYGDSWLRPTLRQRSEASTEASEASTGASTGPARPAPASARPSWLVAGLGAALLLASISGGLTWDLVTGGLWRSADEHQTYPAPSAALTIRGGASDIEVLGVGEPGTVQVSRHLSWGPGSSQPAAHDEWTGSTLTLDAECSGFLGWCSVDYVVTVPSDTHVTVDNGSGDITLTGSLGGLTLKAGSGDIESSNLRAETVSAEVGSGDIDLELASAASPVALKTGSGDVAVRIPPDSRYALTTDSASGAQDVNVVPDPRSSSTLRIETGSGDIDVDYR